jgi:hypothetical protein
LKKKNNKILIVVCSFIILVALIAIAIPYFISQSILSEFKTVNEQLEQTNKRFDIPASQLSDSSKQRLAAFDRDLYDLYLQCDSVNVSVQSLIEKKKQEAINNVEKDSTLAAPYLDTASITQIFIGVARYCNSSDALKLKLGMEDTVGGYYNNNANRKEWEKYTFSGPLAAVIVGLTQMRSDIMDSQQRIITELEERIRKK